MLPKHLLNSKNGGWFILDRRLTSSIWKFLSHGRTYLVCSITGASVNGHWHVCKDFTCRSSKRYQILRLHVQWKFYPVLFICITGGDIWKYRFKYVCLKTISIRKMKIYNICSYEHDNKHDTWKVFILPFWNSVGRVKLHEQSSAWTYFCVLKGRRTKDLKSQCWKNGSLYLPGNGSHGKNLHE